MNEICPCRESYLGPDVDGMTLVRDVRISAAAEGSLR
jgi:hypothetical protein